MPTKRSIAGPARQAPTFLRKAFRGRCIAIVGADGSGKSTMAQLLLDQNPNSFKYIYMGSSIEGSDIALPTSRLLVRIKRRRLQSMLDDESRLPPSEEMPDEMKEKLPRGGIVKALGAINRIAEEWYRQLYIWAYKLRGFLVICDRHFLYDHFPNCESVRPPKCPLSDRVHDAVLGRLFPRPDLTLFLDAPPAVLYARKPEWSIEHLERQRKGILEQGRSGGRFRIVDADRPIDTVFADVCRFMARL